mmetsp:Transcript_52736/g.112546  ORF Transcript_52736/g.112546 Transcript_52736/m.112546 type:complete len:640 (-) Transcript_52736:423-2342(-)
MIAGGTFTAASASAAATSSQTSQASGRRRGSRCCGPCRDIAAGKFSQQTAARVARWHQRGILGWFFLLILLTGMLSWQVPHPKPEEERAHGFWKVPSKGPRPKLPAPQYFTHPPQTETCEICSTSRTIWDPCFAAAKEELCQQTQYKHCVPLKNGSGMLGNYTACMCSQYIDVDALTRVQIGPNVGDQCLLQACEHRDNVCGDGCCRAVNGTQQVCGKTMRLWKPTDLNPEPHRISVCYPYNWTTEKRDGYGFCPDKSTVQKNCYNSSWAPCCSGEPHCSATCHFFLWNELWQKTAIVCGSMVALFLVVRLLSSAWFWREIASRYPDTRAVPAAEAGRPRRKVTVNDFRVCLVLCWSKGLKTAANDAKAVKAKFEKGSYDEVFLLMDDDLTDEKIGQAIKTIIGLCSGHQWPLIVVYYAGHGRSKQEADQLLCSRQQPLSAGPHSWYDLKDMVDMFGSMHTRAGMDDLGLQNAPEPVKNAYVLCILDCCRNEDPDVEQKFGREYVRSVREDYDDLRPRRILSSFDSSQELPRAAKIGFIWSAKRGHVAKDQTREGSRHSPFAAPFLDFMLDPINLCDLFQAIKEKVFEEVGLYIDQLGLADNVTLAPLNAQEQTRATRLLPLVGFERSELASMLTHEDV